MPGTQPADIFALLRGAANIGTLKKWAWNSGTWN
jgi:hypothetical protein